MQRTMKRLFLAAALVITGTLAANAQQLKLTPKNIDKIVKSLTLEEKARLLVGNQNASFKGFESLEKKLVNRVEGCGGYTSAIPRLGIPNTVLTDGPAGVRIDTIRKGSSTTYYPTAFPIGSCLASSWDTDLVSKVGRAMGNEVLEFGCDVILGPGLNLHRSPLAGRNFEYYSEDPVVTGKMAAAMIRGIQAEGVGTSAKHFAGNSQETDRLSVNEVISQRALRELYLKGFEIAVKEGKPWTIMSSYNRLNGPYTQANRELLTTLLRDEWGYEGVVMTDWTQKRETGVAVHAGNDLMEWGQESQMKEIIDKVNSGELSIKDVDLSVKRMLNYIVKTPHFRQATFTNNPDLKAHAEVVRESADECMVLLKNDNNALPIKDIKTAALFGSQSYRLMACGTGAGGVNVKHVVSMVEGLQNAGIKATQSLTDIYEPLIRFVDNKNSHIDDWNLVLGRTQYPNFEIEKDIITEQVKQADIAIITVGHQAGEGVYKSSGHKHGDLLDRPIDGWQGFNLTKDEVDMIHNVSDAFHAAGKKAIVVINSGSVMETASWKQWPDAILMAWEAGGEIGNSVTDILTGKVNPSGKLPMTWPINAMDVPANKNFPTGKGINYITSLHKEGINIGYRYFNTQKKEVSYPFGYGLSFTTFAYSEPKVKATKDGFKAFVTVTNTGNVAGKEAVQLYVNAPKGKLEKPENELKAFAKTRLLAPGEKQTLSFDVTNYGLASFDEGTSQWISDPGTYTVKFASSVEDVRSTATYNLKKAFTLKVNDILKPNHEL
jgi:beta-glucosidase